MNDAPPDMDELLNCARTLLAHHEVDSWLATRSEVRMAGTIRDLLAEVERLQKDRDDAARCMDQYHADRIEQRTRAESAEARLRALCEREPVAVVDTHGIGRILWLALVPDGVRLIPRPSMEDKTNG